MLTLYYPGSTKGAMNNANTQSAPVEFEASDLATIGPINITDVGAENVYFTTTDGTRGFAKVEGYEHTTPAERAVARLEQSLRELQSDLADMVEAGDLTDDQANAWANDKAEQWFGGDQ